MTERADPLQILRDSLAEAQMTVRAYDTKAQIVGVGYIFALGVLGDISDMLPRSVDNLSAFVVASWIVMITPMLLFGFVLHPTRKTAPRLGNDLQSSLTLVLYVDTTRHSTVEGLRDALEQADPVDEYCFELLKVAKLRELKRKRFLRALFAAAVSFVLVFLIHFARSRI